MSDTDATAPQFLERADGARIAYHRTPGSAPGLVFLGGFASDMDGTKALALEAYARERGRAFLRFDYQGHGQSSGRFADGTIGQWRDDALSALDQLTEGPQVLVGSSMGLVMSGATLWTVQVPAQASLPAQALARRVAVAQRRLGLGHPALRRAAPSLRGLDELATGWMNGVQFYLAEDVPMVRGHAAYYDSPWALTPSGTSFRGSRSSS